MEHTVNFGMKVLILIDADSGSFRYVLTYAAVVHIAFIQIGFGHSVIW